MDDTRLPKKAYNMLLFLQRQNYSTWACNVRNMLYMYGYGFVWENQSVGNVKLFIAQLKQRLIDCYVQDWRSALSSHSFYEVYATYRDSLEMHSHFRVIPCVQVRKMLTRFRIGTLPLRCNSLNFQEKRTRRNTYCPFCHDQFETELHFLLVCPRYTQLRGQLIARKYYRQPSLFKFTLLMSNTNADVVKRVCMFVVKAYALRNADISCTA